MADRERLARARSDIAFLEAELELCREREQRWREKVRRWESSLRTTAADVNHEATARLARPLWNIEEEMAALLAAPHKEGAQ